MESIQPQNTETRNPRNTLLYIIIALLLFLAVVQTAGLFYFFRQSQERTALKQTPSAAVDQAPVDPGPYAARPPVYAAYPSYSRMRSAPDPLGSDAFFEDALSSFSRMQERMSRLLDHSALDPFLSGPLMTGPVAIDLEDTGNAYVLTSDLPGLEKDQINVSVNGNILTLQGIRKSESSSQDQSGGYYAQERSYGSFSRSLALPGPVDEGAITASYKEGVLTVTLPKLKDIEGSGGKISVQ
jgi:HSP20 family protein